jgi:sugar-specific transcriptional regulator TrmB
MDLTLLQNIGLSENESKAYWALMNTIEASVSELAKRTQINRSLMYIILEELIQKGLASYTIKNNKRHYRATDPKNILIQIQEKEKIAKQLLPVLSKLHTPKSKKPIVEIFEGKEGIVSLFNDILNHETEWLAFNIPGKMPKIIKIRAEKFEAQRVKQKIPFRAIFAKKEPGPDGFARLTKLKYTQVRFLTDEYESMATTWIYSDRTVMVFWHPELLLAIRIIDSTFANSYRKNFEVMWKNAKKAEIEEPSRN